MSLNEKQNEAIDLLILGNLSKEEVANAIGAGRRTVYNWISSNEEFKAEWQRRARSFDDARVVDAKNKLSVYLDAAISNIVAMATDKDNTKCYEANKYLIDRVLGNTTTKIEQSNIDTTGNKDIKDIDSMLNELDN